jgi:hypothetical protein
MLTALGQDMVFDAPKALLGTDRLSNGSPGRELHSRDQFAQQTEIKQLLNPRGIFNRGKILP